MKILKKSYNFSVKLVKNFNSVSCGGGFECEVDENDSERFEIEKEVLRTRINNEVQEQVKELGVKK